MTPLMWVTLVLAGGLGAAARMEVDAAVVRWHRKNTVVRNGEYSPTSRVLRRHLQEAPLGTFIINISACFALGLLVGASPRLLTEYVTALGTGFLGGYSTFSTAMVETARLLASGHVISGLLHGALMGIIGIIVALIGLLFGSSLV